MPCRVYTPDVAQRHGLSPSTSLVRLTNGIPKGIGVGDNVCVISEYSCRYIQVCVVTSEYSCRYVQVLRLLPDHYKCFLAVSDSNPYWHDQWIIVCGNYVHILKEKPECPFVEKNESITELFLVLLETRLLFFASQDTLISSRKLYCNDLW